MGFIKYTMLYKITIVLSYEYPYIGKNLNFCVQIQIEFKLLIDPIESNYFILIEHVFS